MIKNNNHSNQWKLSLGVGQVISESYKPMIIKNNNLKGSENKTMPIKSKKIIKYVNKKDICTQKVWICPKCNQLSLNIEIKVDIYRIGNIYCTNSKCNLIAIKHRIPSTFENIDLYTMMFDYFNPILSKIKQNSFKELDKGFLETNKKCRMNKLSHEKLEHYYILNWSVEKISNKYKCSSKSIQSLVNKYDKNYQKR